MEVTSEALSAWIGSYRRVRENEGLTKRLEALAEGFVGLGVFSRALIILYNDTLLGPRVGAAGLSEKELSQVTMRSMESRFYDRLVRRATPLTDDLYLVKHDNYTQGELDELIPSRRSTDEFGGGWHPDDMFLAPFQTFGNLEVGNLTGDDPLNGRAPEGDTVRLLRVYLNEINSLLETEVALRTDTYTGLANEMWVEEVLEREATRDEPFALFYGALGDMDQRAQRLGRPYRAEVVKALGEIVRSVTPEGAGAARLHGTEFLVMMRVGDPGRLEGIEANVKRKVHTWNEKERPALFKRLGIVPSLLNDPASLISLRTATAIRREEETAREVLRRAETASRNLFGPAGYGQE